MRKIVVGLLVVVLLSACGIGYVADPGEYREVDMAPSDLVGTWQNRQREGVLVFREDGSFTAGNVPHEVFDHFVGVLPTGFDKTRDRIDLFGTWTLRGSYTEPDKGRGVRLHGDGSGTIHDKGSHELSAMWQGESIVLMFYFGDPDLNRVYVYEKCVTECLPMPTPSAS